jgi:hypothetical protein
MMQLMGNSSMPLSAGALGYRQSEVSRLLTYGHEHRSLNIPMAVKGQPDRQIGDSAVINAHGGDLCGTEKHPASYRGHS